MAAFFPSNDSQFSAWLANFLAVLAPHTLELGLSAPDVTALEGVKMSFDMALGDHITKKAASQGARSLKDTERESVEEVLRALIRRIQASPAMTNDLRGTLGLPVRSDVRTTSVPGEEVPDLYLETVPGKVLVHFGTTPANERTNSKPSWATGCNVYRRTASDDEYSLVAFEMTSPYEDIITGPAADYTYIVQYRGRRASDVGNDSSPGSIAASGRLAA